MEDVRMVNQILKLVLCIECGIVDSKTVLASVDSVKSESTWYAFVGSDWLTTNRHHFLFRNGEVLDTVLAYVNGKKYPTTGLAKGLAGLRPIISTRTRRPQPGIVANGGHEIDQPNAAHQQNEEVKLLQRCLLELEIEYFRVLADNEMMKREKLADEETFIEPYFRDQNKLKKRALDTDEAEKKASVRMRDFQEQVAVKGFTSVMEAQNHALAASASTGRVIAENILATVRN